MGLSLSKDKNIDLYLHTDKQYYISGEYVQGEVYLHAKTVRAYQRLVVRLYGEEYVSWEEGNGEDRRQAENKYKNYEGSCLIKDFHGKVDQGQLVFPFSLLLPSMITGSFYTSSSCYLKYTLRAELENVNPSDSQYYQMFLNIIEPPRNKLAPISITNHVNSKCCKCCFEYGMTSVTLKSDKNFVHTGDTITVCGLVDNSAGTQKIGACYLTLEEYRFMAVSDVSKQHVKDNEYLLGHITDPIYKGASKNFNFTCKIPNQITSYTAIGRIVARYFVLHFYTEYGCCANTAQALLHLVVHSRSPKIVEKKVIPAPEGWNPRISQRITCASLPPYSYNPMPQIPFLNIPTNESVVVPENNGGNAYPPRNLVYPNTQMQEYVPSQMSEQGLYEAYQPVYYNSNIFTQTERQQQGYEPYFGSHS